MATSMGACIFCEIAAGRAPGYVVDEDELSLALLDINPFAEGHTLVISKRHVLWWYELSDEEISSVFRMAKRVAQRIGTAFSPDLVCLYARGRRIPHMHVFLVPTVTGDVLDAFFNALEKVQESPQRLAALKSAQSLGSAAEKMRLVGK